MNKHTPGPWIQQGQGRYIVGPTGFTVADLQPMGEHNAQLICAAPDLLAALRWYVETDEVSDMPGNEFWLEGRERARAAIAKATGNEE